MTFTKPIKRKADRPIRCTRPRYGAMDYFLATIIAVLAVHLGPQVLFMWMEGAR
jgi:hypothetical protein